MPRPARNETPEEVIAAECLAVRVRALNRAVTALYDEYGIPVVFAAGFTPIPYKVFTVAGGVAQINLLAFIVTSIVGRGARFYLVAWVIRRYGDQAKKLIDEYFNILTLAFTVLLIGMFVLLKVLLH